MAELAARSLHDWKVVGSNPAGSNSDWLVSITRIDGYIVSDKYCTWRLHLAFKMLSAMATIKEKNLEAVHTNMDVLNAGQDVCHVSEWKGNLNDFTVWNTGETGDIYGTPKKIKH